MPCRGLAYITTPAGPLSHQNSAVRTWSIATTPFAGLQLGFLASSCLDSFVSASTPLNLLLPPTSLAVRDTLLETQSTTRDTYCHMQRYTIMNSDITLSSHFLSYAEVCSHSHHSCMYIRTTVPPCNNRESSLWNTTSYCST